MNCNILSIELVNGILKSAEETPRGQGRLAPKEQPAGADNGVELWVSAASSELQQLYRGVIAALSEWKLPDPGTSLTNSSTTSSSLIRNSSRS